MIVGFFLGLITITLWIKLTCSKEQRVELKETCQKGNNAAIKYAWVATDIAETHAEGLKIQRLEAKNKQLEAKIKELEGKGGN
jgi:hypothetical protein